MYVLRGQRGFQGLEPNSFLIELSPRAPNFKKTPTAVINKPAGVAAEAAFDGVN